MSGKTTWDPWTHIDGSDSASGARNHAGLLAFVVVLRLVVLRPCVWHPSSTSLPTCCRAGTSARRHTGESGRSTDERRAPG